MTRTDLFWIVILALCAWTGTWILVWLIVRGVTG
jgi:hypothetical protein